MNLVDAQAQRQQVRRDVHELHHHQLLPDARGLEARECGSNAYECGERAAEEREDHEDGEDLQGVAGCGGLVRGYVRLGRCGLTHLFVGRQSNARREYVNGSGYSPTSRWRSWAVALRARARLPMTS